MKIVTGSDIYRAHEICKEDFPYDGEKADVCALAGVVYSMHMKNVPLGIEKSNGIHR